MLPLGFCCYRIPPSPMKSGSQSQWVTKDSNYRFFSTMQWLLHCFFLNILVKEVCMGPCHGMPLEDGCASCIQ